MSSSPSPRPSPSGRGRTAADRLGTPSDLDCRKTDPAISLSLRERVGVRGKETLKSGKAQLAGSSSFNDRANFYAEWRIRSGVVSLLREDVDSPPERLLQAVWQHQRLLRDQLKTPEGQPVRVLHPGFHNLEGGPDFRGAIIQIGDGVPRQG